MTEPRPDDHPERLLRLDAPHFCCGAIVRDDHVIRTAPIVRYLLGWKASRLTRYCQGRGWRVEAITLTGGTPMKDQAAPTSTTTTATAAEAVWELSLDNTFDGNLDEAGWQALLIQIDQEEGEP